MKNNNKSLSIVIDTSASMRDDAVGISTAAKKLIKSNRSDCLLYLRVSCRGIAGSFKKYQIRLFRPGLSIENRQHRGVYVNEKNTDEPKAAGPRENSGKSDETPLFHINKHREILPWLLRKSFYFKVSSRDAQDSDENRALKYSIIQQERCYL